MVTHKSKWCFSWWLKGAQWRPLFMSTNDHRSADRNASKTKGNAKNAKTKGRPRTNDAFRTVLWRLLDLFLCICNFNQKILKFEKSKPSRRTVSLIFGRRSTIWDRNREKSNLAKLSARFQSIDLNPREAEEAFFRVVLAERKSFSAELSLSFS